MKLMDEQLIGVLPAAKRNCVVREMMMDYELCQITLLLTYFQVLTNAEDEEWTGFPLCH